MKSPQISSKEFKQIMASLDELKAALDAAAVTNAHIATVVTEIKADVEDLIAKLAAAGGVPQEILDQANKLGTDLTAVDTALQAIDAEHHV